MCGIAGLFSARLSPADRELAVGRMVQRQAHRGPDDRGFFSGGDLTLGMCRLAIFDPANGHQPMTSPDGRFTIVFNGAIYNHRELRGALETAGWNFRTRCDTEILLAAYAQQGVACLPRLRGMFAFAAWDAVERSLFLARDPLGIKPLYYARLAGGGLAFASELNALLASGQMPREIDPASAGEYLAWFSVPAPRTIYRGIANLPPGHALIRDAAGALRTHAWWHLPAAVQPDRAAANYQDFVHGLRHQLEDSIRAHRIADVPVGAFLSGGMDSAAVVGLMTRLGGPKLKTFSLVFGEADYSEQAAARATAQAFGTEHTEDLLTGARVAADLPRLLASFDQPTGDGINTYYASRLAKAGGVTVALSGLGGDELFGGYPSFRTLPRLDRLLPWWRRLPAGVRRAVLVRLQAARSSRGRKLGDFLAHGRDLHELASLQRRVLSESQRLALLATDARAQATRLGPHHPMLDDYAFELAGADPFQIISGWELRTYMADTLLRDSDVFSMANSLELRVPFVDRPLLEWLWPQCAWFKYDRRHLKRALADATADLLPTGVRSRPKQGFALPFAQWMLAELRPFLEETFSLASLAACPWLEASSVAALWRDYTTRKDPRAWSRVWTVAMLVAFANRKTA